MTLAFIVALTISLNELNMKLQWQGELLWKMFSQVKAFEAKLNLLHKHQCRKCLARLFLYLPLPKAIGRRWRTSSLALFSSFRMYCHQDSEIFTRREMDVIELRNKDTVRCHWRKYTAALWEPTETSSAIRTLVKKMLTTFFNTSASKPFFSWSFVKQCCSQFTAVHLHATLRVFPSSRRADIHHFARHRTSEIPPRSVMKQGKDFENISFRSSEARIYSVIVCLKHTSSWVPTAVK